MTITLHTWARSSGSKVQWALEELGLPYKLQVVDRERREHKQPAFLALNPNGKVPALVDGDEVLFESLAILIHLGERYGLWPAPARERAEALSWAVWTTTELHAYMMQYIYHGVDSPVSYAPDQRSRATAEYNLMNHREHLAMLERRLADRDHIMGDFTLVDIPAADSLAFARTVDRNLEAFPAVGRWLDRCLSRPARARVI